MSEASRDLGASVEPDYVGPDYFAFYTRELAELLSQGEDAFPFSSQTAELDGRKCGGGGEKDIATHSCNGRENTPLASLFANAIGARFSDFKRERVKAVLQQSVIALTQEVDEMLDTVFTIRRIQSHLRCKKSQSNYSPAECEADAVHPHKKIKVSTLPSSVGTPIHDSHKDYRNEGKFVDLTGKETSHSVKKSYAPCHSIDTSKWRTGPKGTQSTNDACGVKKIQGDKSAPVQEQNKKACLVSNTVDGNECKSPCNACGEKKKAGEESPSIKGQNEEACVVSNRVDDNQCKSPSNACGEKKKPGEEPPSIKDQNKEACLVSNRVDDSESKLSDDLQLVLKNDAVKVEPLMKKHSGEVSAMLEHMEQQLEELLDTVLSNCRCSTYCLPLYMRVGHLVSKPQTLGGQQFCSTNILLFCSF
ncbi:uncharacterized protein LOC127804873 isoform X2 [Diospyros lotus]|uniref:uncharacterized protein LOC127804873 isoform X2 n=1 Tax=Diospyros lotus TaxID=55363 RepID=UPI002255F3F7|nr:uncharacterized protein LOC127804873 isoform X2 [Diospyros lotus]